VRCRLCDSSRMLSILDLGAMPPCEKFLTADERDFPEQTYPLHLRLCEDCQSPEEIATRGVTMSTNRQHTVRNICARAKVIAAVAAAGAVVTMGAMTAALGGTEAPKVTAAPAGDGSTAAPPPSTPSVAKAEPPVKAQKWRGNGWPGQ
jgi:Putative zinc binding domain